MTNRELIIKLLDTDLSADCDLKKTIGDVEFKPEIISRWVREGQFAVHCERCNCRVSNKAFQEMRYCFKCGAKMEAY